MLTFTLQFQSGEKSMSVRRVEVHESLSELFAVEVWARSMLWDLELESLVGGGAALQIMAGADAEGNPVGRRWQGVCSHAQQVQAEPTGLSTYYFRIVPRLWFLTQRRNYRIYQHQSIPDILTSLLADWEIEAEWVIDPAAHPKLEYKVQHGESDYAFFCRLLEEAGITHRFADPELEEEMGASDEARARTSPAKDSKLTLCDHLESGGKRPGRAIPHSDNPNRSAEKEFVTKLRLSRDVRPHITTVRGYDFRKPSLEPEASARKDVGSNTTARLEEYYYEPGAFSVRRDVDGDGHYIGGYFERAPTVIADREGHYFSDVERGVETSKHALSRVRADLRAVHFDTNVLDLYPGRLFEVDQHPHPDIGKGPLLATALEIIASTDEPLRATGRAIFCNSGFSHRPVRKTPKPIVSGVQTATVVGDGEVYTDEFGRVRVQFHWDRDGNNDKYSSCWIRVSQPWAGRGFGMIAIPRVGQEVLVAYVDGDPDMPIIVGRAFNATEVVPYPLPANSAVTGWKSCSTPGSTAGGYNEIKFDDTVDRELFYTRAERDKHQLVKRDLVERTLRNKLSKVDGDEHDYVVDNRRRFVGKTDNLHVQGSRFQVVDESVSLTVGKNRNELINVNHAMKAGQDVHIEAGLNLVIEAGFKLTLKVGGNFIDIHPGGVDIVGTIVNINSGGTAGAGRGAQPEKVFDKEQSLEVNVLEAERADPQDEPSP
ncbi:MAG: type VI secretion system tip protein VgrG [Polyangiaceae bacterium]|nr:type VI secretion system tip protein VgrG [Polyangiaceae bacterium]